MPLHNGEYLTEAEAWREIARRIAEGEWKGEGLCWEAYSLASEAVISFATKDRMSDRVKAHLGGDGIYAGEEGWETGPWAFKPGVKAPRVLAALFLALEAEEG